MADRWTNATESGRVSYAGLTREANDVMNMVLPLLLVLATAATWPLNRWALRHGGTPVGIGIVISAIGLAAGVVGSVVTKQPIYQPAAFFFGALGGIAYAAGFVLIILRCLAVGAMGLTALAQSLGLAGTVLATMLVPYGRPASAALCIGLGGALVTVLILGFARPSRDPAVEGPRNRDWSRLAPVGWGFAALCGAAQFLSGRFAPQTPFGYVVAQALVSLLMLLIVASSGAGARPCLPDLVAGLGTGIVTAGLVPLSGIAMGEMVSVHVYPITVAAPVLLVVLLGVFAYRERLTVGGWVACAVGLACLVLLSLPGL